jgi:hyperosmotically inducible protein
VHEKNVFAKSLLKVSACFLSILFVVGCEQKPQHADVKDLVVAALKANNLSDVSVSQDREKGVLTLTGNLQTEEQKMMAENVVKQNAPGYVVADEIGVRPAGAESQAKAVSSNLDDAIESNYKAMIKAHSNLDDQSIKYKAKNGTLVLSGSVKTSAQKAQAGQLATSVPNVQSVVNEIKVEPKKHSSAAH